MTVAAPPVRLVSNDDGSITLSVGRETAVLSRAAWSKLLAHPEAQTPGSTRPLQVHAPRA